MAGKIYGGFIMANWEEIRQTVESTAYKAIRKTEEIADTASVHIKLKAISAKLNLKYTDLGKLSYKQIKTGKESAGISEVVAEIDSLRNQAKTLRDKLEKAKTERKSNDEDDFRDFENTPDDAESASGETTSL